ncbi:MAG: PadR family transcriptional regulator [Anaerolineae bacterium]|nr:PadR family transcriptional regulator [Anaerolineae bacterium]
MTDAELAILSIVAEGPVHGYDIQTIIVQRGLRAWTNVGVSSMYYVLEKLERQGLIESQGEHRGASHREYRITSAGYGVLQTAVADLVSTPREYATGFELGLANLHVLRPPQIKTAFVAYRQELVSRLSQARERWQQLRASRAPFNVAAMFEHHVAMLEAELDWIKRFIEEWEAQLPPDAFVTEPPEPVDIPRNKQVVLPHDPDSPHRVPTRPLKSLSDTDQAMLAAADTDMFDIPVPDSTTPASARTTSLSAQTPRDLVVDEGVEAVVEDEVKLEKSDPSMPNEAESNEELPEDKGL